MFVLGTTHPPPSPMADRSPSCFALTPVPPASHHNHAAMAAARADLEKAFDKLRSAISPFPKAEMIGSLTTHGPLLKSAELVSNAATTIIIGLKKRLQVAEAAKAAATGLLAGVTGGEAGETAEKYPAEREAAEKTDRAAAVLAQAKSASAELAADEARPKSDDARAKESTAQRLAGETHAEKAAAEDEATATTATLKMGKMYVKLCWVLLAAQQCSIVLGGLASISCMPFSLGAR